MGDSNGNSFPWEPDSKRIHEPPIYKYLQPIPPGIGL